MRIDIITAIPQLLDSFFGNSIIKRAIDKKIVEIKIHNLRDYSNNKYKQIDDYQFGGGSGMVLMIEPIDKCIDMLKSQREYDEIIYMTPDAKILEQSMCNKLSIKKNIIILCGHYKGIDQRIRDNIITLEISIGNFVLSGGELAAAILTDSIVRLIPNVLGDGTSALSDSFQDGLLSAPIYTRPSEYKGQKVPEILLSGDQKKIDEWRTSKSIERTKILRPELLKDD
ncbi:tRNA (guanosine(37)-N1)-methyltransferase TrmD [Ichthyobacterium seriolicida]|uniref:tRNA (guanine-N(1)-)-methyltransferase n=1 Tax=Ichthyobacterium seriolicida TaxID=242600 RepID=A0A1J1EBX0_9FLAO|nr:tRNA (guanosine(37)-N1)-methyltransferase TrmD [Ichthyobacterium seriolicida]BAV95435.1 tRNA (Guanine37-N1) -methyltransferase [Ichthyobacterium seriolicida]